MYIPSRGGLEVERWFDNRLHSALVGPIPSKYGVSIVQKWKHFLKTEEKDFQASSSLPDVRPRSVPALELQSRAKSSVGNCTTSVVPTQGAIPEKGGYKKNNNNNKYLEY